MKMKMKGIVLAMLVLLCAGNAGASVIWTFSSLDQGAEWRYRQNWWSTKTRSASEINVTFATPYDGIKSTFGYCVELGQNVTLGKTYTDYSIVDISGNYMWAAWLMEKYIPNTIEAPNFTGATDRVLISALQASIWSITGQHAYDPIASFWNSKSQNAVYVLYSEMMGAYIDALKTLDINSLGLQNAYKLLVSDKHQDILVRTSTVPLPGAAILFGSGLLGLVGLRRRQIR